MSSNNIIKIHNHAPINNDELRRNANRLPKVEQEINDLIKSIATLVSEFPLYELMLRIRSNAVVSHMGIESESELSSEQILNMRMIDYIQSVVASTPRSKNQKSQLTDEDWETLRSSVRTLFEKFNIDYKICKTSKDRLENPNFDIEKEMILYGTQMIWTNVRGYNYPVHYRTYLSDMFAPHSDIIKKLFGITSQQFIDSMHKISNSLIFGVGDAFNAMEKFRKESLDALESKIKNESFPKGTEPKEAMEQVINENGWQNRRRSVFGKIFELDLCDIEKITSLPKSLLDELSWKPGEDSEFFGSYEGWPSGDWSIFRRPFICINGRYYCFETNILIERIYRVMQRIIFSKAPEYKERWNEVQAEQTENLIFKYFEKILPGAKIYQNVYYQHHGKPGSQKKEWCEADGLIIYNGHLFVIEAKAGAFTPAPPESDFPSYIQSLKNLVLKAARQGNRFIDYLNSGDEVALFNQKHEKIGCLRKADFHHITVCPITADSFTGLAAQVQHLKKIDVDVGSNPIWTFSLDDLRVFADIFEDPLVFLNYVEQRILAFHSDAVQFNDELDHIGFFIKYNTYSAFIEKHTKNKGILIPHGYRYDIDKFFNDRLVDPKTPSPLGKK